jgi:ribonuclease VapC
VLDASALLAVLNREPGEEVVAPILYGSTVSAINYSEVLKKVIERGADVTLMSQFLDRQQLVIVPFDRERAIAAASILPHTKARGLSFADRACLATGREFSFTVYTAEKRMSETTLDVTVKLIRPHKEQ